ncbi:MAG: hypothetical protein PHO46_01150 [Thermoguttaceae bacterium]|jgi:hypothetical protein|nr:hypothetical protein [Thermoguttaceae bacterium]
MSRKPKSTDSLELFLDAICNMFGGFLFIMLFVVVSIRATRDATIEQMMKDEGAVPAAELQAMETALDALVVKQRRLEKNVEDAQDFIDKLSDPELAKIYEVILQKTQELRKTIEENAKADDELKETKNRAKYVDDELKKLEEELELQRDEVKAAEESAVAAKVERSRKTDAPQMRPSFKLEIGVVLKYGRLYFWHKHDGEGWIQELNTDDFVAVEERENEIRTEPKPWAGVDLSAPDVDAKLSEAFAKCDKTKEKIVVVVAADSYEHYSTARDFLKREGFDMRPVTGKVGTSVADRGGTNTKAQ